jgi:dTDP-4-amino-4,6-dideoxygalactose transaminase
MIKWLNRKAINYDRVQELLQISTDVNHFTNFGPVSTLLENIIHEKLEIAQNKVVIAVSNGSHALHAVVAAIELRDGHKKYAVPAFTFPTNIQGNLQDSLVTDVNDNFGLCLNDIKFNLETGDNIDGIIVTNIFGNTQDISEYVTWAKDNNKVLIFDNAATPFSLYKKSNVNNYGLASIISFHHTKPLGFGEGGAIIIDKEYEKYVRRVLNFGFDNNRQHSVVANNWKMSDISAAFILQHLDSFQEIVLHHKMLYATFYEELFGLAGVKLFPNSSLPDESLVSGLAVVFDDTISLDYAINHDNWEIDFKKYYMPLTEVAVAPKAHDLYNRILIYPCNMDMTKTDVLNIVQHIKNCLNA